MPSCYPDSDPYNTPPHPLNNWLGRTTRSHMDSFGKPWPERGDKIFRDDEDGSEAWVSVISPTFYAYATAYRASAELLIEHRKSLSGLDQNFQILPIVFLYRQHVELLLKAIIKNGDDLQRTEQIKSNLHHDLNALWREAERVMDENLHNAHPKARGAAGGLISELAQADPGSFAFRYPVGKKEQISLEGWERVSLDNFASVMEKLSNFLLSALYDLYHTEGYS